jgi:hypothetical protein
MIRVNDFRIIGEIKKKNKDMGNVRLKALPRHGESEKVETNQAY